MLPHLILIKRLEKLFISNDINFKQYKEDLQIEFSWQQLIFQLYAKNFLKRVTLGDLNLINKNDELEDLNYQK